LLGYLSEVRVSKKMKESGVSTGGREDDKFPHANSMQLSIDSVESAYRMLRKQGVGEESM
jgi:hypothetical protein